MNQEQYLAEFKKLTEEMYELTKRKNHDYASSVADPFKNFKMIEQMGVCTVEQGFITRMTDKMMRLAGFTKTGVLKVEDEKIEDTLLDLATYSLLMVCYIRSQKEMSDVLTT